MKKRFSPWQLVLVILVFISMACNLGLAETPAPVITPTPSATPVPLAPTIVETIPAVNSVVSPKSLFTLFFSEKMDRGSVENALSGDFPGGFVFSWVDDATLTLAPKNPLPTNSKVTYTLGAGAKSSSGLSIQEPVSFSYQTPGALGITQVLPAAGTADVSPDSAVVVAFNQPVVPLGAYSASLPEGLTLEPAAPGKGEWINTSTYIFHADPGLSGGVQYTARVNPALVSVNGMPLDPAGAGSSWSFNTTLPEITGISPQTQAGGINLDSVLEISFNQPMDKTSVDRAFSFDGPGGKVPGSFEWNKKSNIVKFTPSALLSRNTTYTLGISEQAHSLGGAALTNKQQVIYQTVPDLQVVSSSFPKGQVRPFDQGIAITFSAPLKSYTIKELNGLISIDAESAFVNYYIDGSVITVDGMRLPGKTYTVTFSGKLADRWGQELGQDFVFNFSEPDAQPSLDLGSYIPVLFTRPEDPRISVQAVNINNITVTKGSLSLDDFVHFEEDYQFQQSYIATDQESWNINPGLTRNENQPVMIELNSSPLNTGLYLVNTETNEVPYPSNNRRGLVISNLNVTMKSNAGEVLLWAIDLRTQLPAQNLPVRILATKDNQILEIATGTTDAKGLWHGPIARPSEYGSLYAVLAQPGEDQFGMAANTWDMGISPWDFSLRYDGSGKRPEVYLYSERPVYRPGDSVFYRGILRNWYDGRYSSADIKDITITWYGPDGKLGQPLPVTISSYGTFNGEYKLPANATPGNYNLNVESAGNLLTNGVLVFQVADYRKPEINLSVKLNPSPALSGELVTGSVQADYFFGTPAPDLPFTWRLYMHNSYFNIPEYTTGIQESRWLSFEPSQFGVIYKSGEGRTGPDGSFNLPIDDLKVDSTAEITLEVTASESGGFPVSARDSLMLHPEKAYIGVRPDAWVGKAGSELGFGLFSVDWNLAPVSQSMDITFEKVRWERTDGLYGNFRFDPIYTPLEKRSITSGADGKSSLSFIPPEAGTYVLDARSGNAHTQALVWVTGGENAEWPNLPYQQIQLTANQEKFKPGDTARVFIPNPFNTPSQALLTTERSTFKSIEVVTIPAEGYNLSLALTDEAAPNIYVSATLIGPQGVEFRQGYLNLPVEPSTFSLNVDLKATPEKAKPGDTVTLDLTVSDSSGQPVQGEFSIAMVDLAALAIAEPNSIDILPAYYSIQPLGIRTSLTAVIYTRRLLSFPGGRGGVGGGDVMTVRSKYPDTAYWKADIVTDAQGKGQISVTLPDNLTTWQVDTRGLSQDTRVGQARVRVVTSKDLLIRPQTPRFLVVGDHAELAAMVNNTSGQDVQATVSLQAPGLTLDDPALAQQKINIPANGRARVSWSGLVENSASIDAVFLVSSGQLSDAARPNDGPIPVIRYTASQTFSTAGVLSEAATRQEIIAVPRSFQPLGGNLQVELSPSLAATILESLKAMESSDQPWSSEELVSTLLPNLATYRALKDSGIEDKPLADRLQTNLANDLRQLLTFRHETGGWRWTTTGTKSDPYLTAYVLYVFEQAIESGISLDGLNLAEIISNTRGYLFSNAEPFAGTANLEEPWQANRAVFYCYVLEQSGGMDSFPSLPDSLYDSRERLDPWAKSMLAMTLYKISNTDERVNGLISDLEASAIRSSTGAHWESSVGDWHNPGTALFTTAVVVNGIAERNPASPLAAEAVRYLSSQRGPGGRWASSYETAWVILALNKYMQGSGELRGDFTFSAELNGKPLAQGQAAGPQNMTTVISSSELNQLNLSGANLLTINKQDGTGKLYYRAALTVDRPVESAPALERGISISREYLDCSNTACQPITAYQMKSDQSGRVTVRLTMTIPNEAYYLMLEDHIPAGAEILDSSLKTSQQGQESQTIQAQFDPADPFGEGWGWWLFNRPQIYSNRILWSADYLPAGSYQLTYTLVPSLAGEYRVIPARAWQTFFPEIQGSSAGTVFEIKP